MRILDLNVNGYKAFLTKGGREFILNESPDIICLQEIRTDVMEEFSPEFLYQNYNKATRKGYAGTMVLSKTLPVKDLTEQYDWGDEGRLQVLDFDSFILVNVYVPSSLRNPERFSYRMNFNEKFIKVIEELINIKPVIICGDFNCARSSIDMDVNAKDYEANEFLTNEREILIDLEELGFYDPVRKLYRNKRNIYSWRSPKDDTDKGSQGRRLDYCYLSPYFPKDLVKNITYLPDLGLSDHFPMIVELKSLTTLKQDFDNRREWEAINLKEAQNKRTTLINKAKDAITVKDKKIYINTLTEIADSKEIKALAVEKTLQAKVNPNIKEMNWHFTHNKIKALNGIDLKSHKMDKVFFFEVEEKGKIRKIGKLSRKDYAAHYLMAQLIKPYHDITCDFHSYAYLEDKSHITLHNLLQLILEENFRLKYLTFIDIKNFFGSLNHNWIYRNVPVPSIYLKNILKTQNVIDGKIYPSDGRGISMGSPAAAYLANICLNGLEDLILKSIKEKFGNTSEIRFLRFSDDILILTEGRKQAKFAYTVVEDFLKERALEVNPNKSYIVNFKENPFVLMNWEYRFIRGNLVVKPTRNRINYMKKELNEIFKKKISQSKLIKRINEKIMGWGNDLRYCDSKYTFWELDTYIENKLFEKTSKAHRFLGKEIIKSRYFINSGVSKQFCLPKDKTLRLKKLSDIPLVKENKTAKNTSEINEAKRKVNEKYRGIWKRQNGCCALCGEPILPNEERSLIKINKVSSYIHKECRGRPVHSNNVVFDLTLPVQINKAIVSELPYLTDKYIFPGLPYRALEDKRRMLHNQDSEIINFSPNQINSKIEEYWRTRHNFAKALKYEGYLSTHIHKNNTISARKEQDRKILLKIPEWIDELNSDDLIILKTVMTQMKGYYGL